MLAFLLDEHISPTVAKGLRRRRKELVVHCLAEWEAGKFLGLADDLFLAAASGQKLTLVTYDRRTIPRILQAWAEEGRTHGGVVFVDDKTIPPSDFGALVRALDKLQQQAGDWDWDNRVYTLSRS